MKIIALNGPPGSGKDTVALWLGKHYYDEGFNVITEKFAKPLKAMAAGMFGWTIDSSQYEYYFETHEGKGKLIEGTDITYRQLLIKISEDFIKPLFGADAFGKLLVKRLVEQTSKADDYVIISDCGFVQEILPLLDTFGFNDVYLIRLHRDGCDYNKDSRSYVRIGLVHEFDIYNNGSIVETVDEIIKKVG